MSLRTRVVLLACAALGNVSYGAAPAENPTIQVLLQGDDPDLLAAALERNQGHITHTLPLVRGIGGEIPAANLQALHDSPGVERVIEDFNPQEPDTERDCPIDGALQVLWSGNELRWPIYNFAPEPVTIVLVDIDLPSDLGEPKVVSLAGQPLSFSSHENNGLLFNAADVALSPGRHILALKFESPIATPPSQSSLSIKVHTPTCAVTLLPAYTAESGHYHYASVSGAAALHAQGITGRGVNVAIIDSGLWEHSEALRHDASGRPRVIARFDAITDTSDAPLIDESGHGSHIASVVANSGWSDSGGQRRFKGIAPNAGLIPVKVFDASGNGDFLDILRAIQWVIAHRKQYDIRVLNLSLAAAPRFPYWDDPINQALLRAWQAGMTVVVAAGNEGPTWQSVGSPGNNPYVITVGAVTDSWTPDDFSDDYIPDFSSRGPSASGHRKPDLVAPGGHIPGIVPVDSTMARDNPNWFVDTGDFVSTGSSQAAAIVSGIAALLLEIEPTLTNNEIKCLLTTSARPAINRDGRLSYSRFTQGAGYVDAVSAVTLGQRDCAINSGDIEAAIAGREQLLGPAEMNQTGYPLLPGDAAPAIEVAPEKGTSSERRWGVQAHIDRLRSSDYQKAIDSPLNGLWLQQYLQQRQKLLELQSDHVIQPKSGHDSSSSPH